MNFTEKDLSALAHVFFDVNSRVFVLDPGNLVIKNFNSGFVFVHNKSQILDLQAEKERYYLINLSGANIFSFPFEFSKVDGIISFSASNDIKSGFFHYELYYIDDVFGHLRWLFSKNHTKNDFLDELEEETSSIDINNLISLFPFIINYIRLKSGRINKITDGAIQVYKRKCPLIPGFEDSLYDSFSLNLKRTINSGILGFKLYKNKKLESYLQYAVSKDGLDIITREQKIILELTELNFTQFVPKKIICSEKALLFSLGASSGEMDYYRSARNIHKIIKGVSELYQNFNSITTISEFFNKENIWLYFKLVKLTSEQKLLPRGLSQSNFDRLINVLLKIVATIDLQTKIPLSFANNQLIPKNMIQTGNRIVLLNWEYAEYELPLLFDIFAYLFIHIEGFENPESDNLLKEIRNMKADKTIKEITENYHVDFDLHLKLFILYHVSKDIGIVLNQKVVRPEINLKHLLWTETAADFFKFLV